MTIFLALYNCLHFFYFSQNTENPSIARKEVANASEILDKYLRKKCYDKRTRPNVTGNYNCYGLFTNLFNDDYLFISIYFHLFEGAMD